MLRFIMRPHYLISIFIAIVSLGAGFAYTITPIEAPQDTSRVPVERVEITLQQPRDLHSETTLESEASAQDNSAELYTDISVYTIPILSEMTVLESMDALAANSDFSFSGSEFPGLG